MPFPWPGVFFRPPSSSFSRRTSCCYDTGHSSTAVVNTMLTMNQLARVLNDKGEFGEAEGLYREAIEGLTTAQGAKHANTLITTNNPARSPAATTCSRTGRTTR